MSRPTEDEALDAAHERLVRERFHELHSGFMSNDRTAVKFVCDGFSDLLSDQHLVAKLIRLAIVDELAAGAELARLVSVVLLAEAEEFADANCQAVVEANRAQELADRAEQAYFDRQI